MNSSGDAFGFPFRSPGWGGTLVLQGLILIIPIIGQIALLGWLLLTLDNLRAGRPELAPAGFHLERGIALFGVQLIYGIVLAVVPAVVLVAGGFTVGQSNAVGGLLIALGVLLALAAAVFQAFLTPVLILRTSLRGFSGGMDVVTVWQQATVDVGQTVLAALLVWVAGVIGGLGVVVCFVGQWFTTAYAYGVMAGVVSWYERTAVPQSSTV